MSPAGMRCREIVSADLDGIVDLLVSGFPNRSRDYWLRAIGRLSEHPRPSTFPKYGYLLEHKSAPVGVILLIFSSITVNGKTRIRCNLSGWYVQPAFRSHASLLVLHALKYKHVTYLNVTPRSNTLPTLELQGYKRYSSGWFMAVPALCARSYGANINAVSPHICPDEDLQPYEIELLLAHAGYGCISLIGTYMNRRHPFVFAPKRKFGLMPFAYLAYCRDLEDFVQFAGPLGRFLAWRGFPMVALDSNGPIHGLIGAYIGKRPKYFKGPDQPHLGDLAYTELAMFGTADWIWRDWRSVRAEISSSIPTYFSSIFRRFPGEGARVEKKS